MGQGGAEMAPSPSRDDGQQQQRARAGSISQEEVQMRKRISRDPKLNGVWVVITHPLRARVFRPCHHGPDESCTAACGDLSDFVRSSTSGNDIDKSGLPVDAGRRQSNSRSLGLPDDDSKILNGRKRCREIQVDGGSLLHKGAIPEYPIYCGTEFDHLIPLDTQEERRLLILLKTICRFELQRVQRHYGDILLCRAVDEMLRRFLDDVEGMLKNGTVIVGHRRVLGRWKSETPVEIPTLEVARMVKLERRKAQLLLMRARLSEEERLWQHAIRREQELDDQCQQVADTGLLQGGELKGTMTSSGTNFLALIEENFKKIFCRLELHCQELEHMTCTSELTRNKIEESCTQLVREYQKRAFSDLASLGDPRTDIRSLQNFLPLV